MTNEERLPNGNLRVPTPGTGPDGEIADGLQEIGPEHPLFATWDEHLKKLGR